MSVLTLQLLRPKSHFQLGAARIMFAHALTVVSIKHKTNSRSRAMNQSQLKNYMSKSIEDRKKSGPLMPKWLAIKGRNKALSNGSFFKPDITPAIKGYDDTIKTYDDL